MIDKNRRRMAQFVKNSPIASNAGWSWVGRLYQ
jgi:hypothetical protein